MTHRAERLLQLRLSRLELLLKLLALTLGESCKTAHLQGNQVFIKSLTSWPFEAEASESQLAERVVVSALMER